MTSKKQQVVNQLGSLNKNQEVLYQKEFKRADRAYKSTTIKGVSSHE